MRSSWSRTFPDYWQTNRDHESIHKQANKCTDQMYYLPASLSIMNSIFSKCNWMEITVMHGVGPITEVENSYCRQYNLGLYTYVWVSDIGVRRVRSDFIGKILRGQPKCWLLPHASYAYGLARKIYQIKYSISRSCLKSPCIVRRPLKAAHWAKGKMIWCGENLFLQLILLDMSLGTAHKVQCPK